MMKTAIVIPNWNGEKKLVKHLPTVIKAAKNNNIHEIIIVDDASTDNSVSIIKKNFPEIKLIEKKQNSGFSSTVNLGVGKVSADLVVLLNSDASPDNEFLKPILPHFQNQKVFSVGCNVGGLWTTAAFKNGFFWHGKAEGKLPNKAHNTLWVSGGSGVFRKSIWDKLGGLDELYDPFYEEDLDIGYRAIKRGYINLWEPTSIVAHYQEKGVIQEHFSKQKVSKIAQRNQLIFIWKNITSKSLFIKHQIALARMLITHPKYWGVFLPALGKLGEIKKKREIEKQQQKITDEQVLEMFGS